MPSMFASKFVPTEDSDLGDMAQKQFTVLHQATSNIAFPDPPSSFAPAKPKEEPTWYDQTIGSFLYGGAETLGLAARKIGNWLPGDDWFDQAGRSLDDYVKGHPNYAPMEVSSAWDLVTNPKALVSRAASGLPFVLGTVALMQAGAAAAAVGVPAGIAAGIGAGGMAAAWGLTYAIESRRGFESALQDGQDESTAELKGTISGVVGTVLNMVPLHKYFKVAEGAQSSLISALVSKGATQVEAAGLRQKAAFYGAEVAGGLAASLTKKEMVHEAARFLAFQTAVGTLSGTSDDLISLGLYGKPLPREYFDKILQSAINAGVNAEALGFAFKKGHDVFGKDPLKHISDLPDPTKLEIPFGKQDLYNKAYEQSNNSDYAKELTNVTNSMVQVYAERNAISESEAWGKLISKKESDLPRDRIVAASEVGNSITKVDQALANVPPKGVAAGLKEAILNPDNPAGASREDLMNAGIWDLLNNSREIDRQTIVKRMHDRGVQVAEAMHGPEFSSQVTTNLNLMQQGLEILDKSLAKAKTPQEQQQLQGQKNEALKKYKEVFDTQFQKSADTQSNVVLMDVPGKSGKTELAKMSFRNVVDERNGTKVMLIDDLTNTSSKTYRQAIQAAVDAGMTNVAIKVNGTEEWAPQFLKTVQALDKTGRQIQMPMGGDDVVMMPLTKNLKARLFAKASKDNVLQYSGTGRILDSGQAVLTAMSGHGQGMMEQIFNVFKNTLEDPEQKVLAAHAGVKDGNWTPENNKKIIRSWMTYFKDGIAPNAELAGTFNYFRKFVTKMYGSVKALGKQGALPDDVRNVFDQMLYKDTSPITAKRIELKGVVEELAKHELGQLKKPVEEPKTGVSVKPVEPTPEEVKAKEETDVHTAASKEARMMAYKLRDGTVVFAKKATSHANVMNAAMDHPDEPMKLLADPSNIVSSGVVEKGMYRDTYTVGSKPEPLEPGKVAYVDYQPPKADKAAESKAPEAKPASKEGTSEAKPTEGGLSPEIQKQILVNRAEQLRGELRTLQSQSLKPRVQSEAARMEEFHSKLIENAASPQESKARKYMGEAYRGVKKWITDVSADLRRTTGGKYLLENLDQVGVERGRFAGKHELERVSVMNALTEGEKKLIAGDISKIIGGEDTGLSVHRAITDKGAVPEQYHEALGQLGALSDGLKRYVEFHKKIWNDSTQEALKLNVMRVLGAGRVEPLKQSKTPSVPRSLTSEGYTVVRTKSGEPYQGLIKKIMEWNPHLTLEQITTDLDRSYGLAQATERDFGALEHTRAIRYMPDFVKLKSGEITQILHTEPVSTTIRTIDRYGQRTGFIKYFGQGLINNATMPELTRLLTAVGLQAEGGKLKPNDFGNQFLTDLGLDASKGKLTDRKSAELIKAKLLDAGFDPGQISKDVYAQADALGIPTKITPDDVIAALEKVDTTKLTDKDMRRMLGIAKDLKGISTSDTNPQKLFADMLDRVKTKYPEYLVDKLRRLHVQEGGSEGEFNKILAMAQGIPLHIQSQNIIAKVGRLASNILGAAQTSLAAVPNMTQTMTQVPQLVGTERYIQSVRKVLQSPNLVESDLLQYGAFRKAALYFSREPGFTLDEFGRTMKQVVSAGTLQMKMSNLNNLISGESFRAMADYWHEKGVTTPGEIRKLKFLGMTDAEIAEIKDKKMSERTFAKIVQQGVAKTQFITDAPYNKSGLENNPVTSSIFNYMSYATGTIKANINVASDFFAALKSGNPADIFNGMKRTTTLIAGLYGAGMASMVLRQAIKGDFSQLKKDYNEDKYLGALTEAGLLGPVQRTISSFDLSGNSTDKAILGMFPHLSALADGINVALGRGKFADFTFSRRLEEAFFKNTPIAKAVRNWYDETAYPDIVQYKDVRQRVALFNEKVRDSKNQVIDTQLNAEHYPIAEWLMRGDLDNALEERTKWIKTVIDQGKDPKKEFESLRSSLVSRAPMNVEAQYLPFFMASLPKEQRYPVLSTHLKYMAMVNTLAPR